MYNVHPYFVASFQKKKKVFQCHSDENEFFGKILQKCLNLALPGVDANHLMFYLFSDTSSFMMFSSAERLNVIHLHNACNIFINKQS